MTTTVKVHVGGNYEATVKQDDREPVKVGPNQELSFYLPHPAKGTFEIEERYLGEQPAGGGIPEGGFSAAAGEKAAE